MSDQAEEAKIAQQISEYDFIYSTIEFTKLCVDKCDVLKGVDDKLDRKEIACLSKFSFL